MRVKSILNILVPTVFFIFTGVVLAGGPDSGYYSIPVARGGVGTHVPPGRGRKTPPGDQQRDPDQPRDDVQDQPGLRILQVQPRLQANGNIIGNDVPNGGNRATGQNRGGNPLPDDNMGAGAGTQMGQIGQEMGLSMQQAQLGGQ